MRTTSGIALEHLISKREYRVEPGLAVSRVTLVGLDGASLPLIQEWAESGQLPGFLRLMKEGGWGGLQSTIPPISPSAWTSIFTGVTPGKHGIFGFVKRRENSYFPRPIGSMDIQVPLLWRLLTAHGLKSAWVHIPFVYPPEPIEGVLITGLGTPSKRSDFVFPPELKTKLLGEHPDFDVDFNEDRIELSHNIAQSLRKVEQVTDASIRIFEDLRRDTGFRLVAGVFRALDVVQHYKIHEPGILLPYYQKFDQLILRCYESARQNEVLIVCSDHGFRQVQRSFHINNWLESIGMLKMKRKPRLRRMGVKAETFQKVLVRLGLKGLVWKIKRSSIGVQILGILPSDDFNLGVDWENTKAYYIGNEGGTIYLNLAGREPKGIVEGSEVDAVADQIVSAARNMRDPSTGRIVASRVIRRSELYDHCVDDAPDILMVENEPYAFSGRYNYDGDNFSVVGSRRGDHSMEGILFMGGANVARQRLRGASVWDIAPTTLYLLGVPIPEHFDGRVLGAAFSDYSPESTRKSTVRIQEFEHILRAIIRLRQSGRV